MNAAVYYTNFNSFLRYLLYCEVLLEVTKEHLESSYELDSKGLPKSRAFGRRYQIDYPAFRRMSKIYLHMLVPTV